MPTRLANADLELVVPSSFAVRYDLIAALAEEVPMHRLAAAALGLCWPRVSRKIKYSGRVIDYGAAVLDALTAEGATVEEIYHYGAEALRLVTARHLPSQAGVESALGNSAAPTGSTSP